MALKLKPARWFKPAADETFTASAMVAAARRVEAGYVKKRRRAAEDAGWQNEAWEHYRECGQLRYMINLAADMMSRARLFVTMLDENGEPAETPPENTELSGRQVFGGPTVQKQLLQAFGIQLGVPGECWLIGEQEKDDTGRETGRERWCVVSTDEFTEDPNSGAWIVDNGNGKRELDQETTAVIRVWKPDPRKYEEADSQVRANRRPLRILARLAQYTQALLDSRLAGPGILLLPKELTFAAPNQKVGKATQGATEFLQLLTDAMTAAIEAPDDPEALVPIVVQGPAEHLKEARLLTMNTPLTENLAQIEEQAIKNLALGLDAPPEMLLGLSDTNHWSAWQLEEATIKYVVEPLLELVCSALTEQFLWPILDEQGMADSREWLIWYDSAELTKRPDKSASANDVYDKGELSGDALRREHGFSDDDKPNAVERELKALMALAQAVPAVAAQIAPRILELIAALAEGAEEAQGEPLLEIEQPVDPNALPAGDEQGQPADTTEDGERTGPPERSDQAGLLATLARTPPFVAACEQIALAALRTANRRNAGRNRHALTGMAENWHTQLPVLEVKVGELLAGTLDTVDQAAARLGVDRDSLFDALHGYLAVTLVGRLPHDADRMADHVAQHVVAVAGRAIV